MVTTNPELKGEFFFDSFTDKNYQVSLKRLFLIRTQGGKKSDSFNIFLISVGGWLITEHIYLDVRFRPLSCCTRASSFVTKRLRIFDVGISLLDSCKERENLHWVRLITDIHELLFYCFCEMSRGCRRNIKKCIHFLSASLFKCYLHAN